MKYVYHLAEEQNWPTIRVEGLLCASDLVRQAELAQPQRLAAARHRDANLVLPGGRMLRDQKPMPPARLRTCLDGGFTPGDWYALLNGKVFFWCDVERLNRHRAACAARAQVVMVMDAQALIAANPARASVSPINTGYALRVPARRGLWTFVPVERWQRDGWESHAGHGTRRASTHPPAELTIDGSLPDAARFLVDAYWLEPGAPFRLPAPLPAAPAGDGTP